MSREPSGRRARRTQVDLRDRLLAAALAEFSARGFDGASTRAIAVRAGAHQPQINYHFASKEALWRAAIEHLFGLLVRELDANVLVSQRGLPLAQGFADMLRRLVRFVARHPELNRIMVHESTSPGARLTWMTENHVRPLYLALRRVWKRLLQSGIAAPIDPKLIHHVLVGAASLVFVNAAELELLEGIDAMSARWIDRHADGLIATFLPGLGKVDRQGGEE